MAELYEKMVKEAMMAQKADVETIKKNRGKDFKIKDTKAYLDVVQEMEAAGDQSEAVINLHKDYRHHKTRRRPICGTLPDPCGP